MRLFESLNFGFGNALPVVLQTEAAECGIACLAMVASYHGYITDLPSMRQRFAVSLKGLNLAQLIQVAGRLSLSCRPLRVELQMLRELQMPAILHWNLNHYVVLKSVRNGKVTIHDPALGVQVLTLEQASKHFTGVVLELEPTLNFKQCDERQTLRLRTLMGNIRGLKRSLFQVAVLALALEIFTLAGPFLMQWIVDDALVSADKDLVTVVALGMLLLGILRAAVGLIRSWVLLYMSASLNVQWLANVLDHLLKLPMPFFEKRHIGDVISRFGGISAIQQTLTTGFVSSLIDGLMVVTTMAMMFIYSPPLAMIAVAAMGLYCTLRLVRYGALRLSSEGLIVRTARQQSYFMEIIRGIQAIKLFNRQADRRTRFLKMAVESTNSSIEVQRLNITFQAVNSVLVAGEGVWILWLGSQLVLDRTFTIGMLLAFIAYKDQFTTRASGLVDKLMEIRMLRLQAERLADIVLTQPEPEGDRGYLSTEPVPATLELRNVRFRYGEGERGFWTA